MPAAGKMNAIEKRIENLTTQWLEFTDDPPARLLRWLIVQDEVHTIDTFFDVECDEGGETPDLFVKFSQSFDDGDKYGYALVEALKEKYEDDREELAKIEIDASWQCPAITKSETDVDAFVRCCFSLWEHYQGKMTNFAAILTPESGGDDPAFQLWLSRLLRAASHQTVRFIILDDLNAPKMETLAEAWPERMISMKADLDMPGAYEELANNTPGTGPGPTFQRQFVALSNAATKGDLKAVDRLSKSALKIATDQNWRQMQMVIHMVVGGAYIGDGQSKRALGSYQAAGKAAEQAEAEGDPAGPRLVVTSRMSEGSALFNDEQYAEAAKVYEETAPLAAKLEDHVLTIENWRMAAYCYEQIEEFKPAWNCGQKALDVGELMEPDKRETTTLPYAGQGLLRVAKAGSSSQLASKVNQQMIVLIGPDWEQLLEEGAAKS